MSLKPPSCKYERLERGDASAGTVATNVIYWYFRHECHLQLEQGDASAGTVATNVIYWYFRHECHLRDRRVSYCDSDGMHEYGL